MDKHAGDGRGVETQSLKKEDKKKVQKLSEN